MLWVARWCLLLLCVPGLLALYDEKDAVVALDETNFIDMVVNSPTPAVVEFYTPGCMHCVQFAPQYKKAADNLKGIAVVGAVNCDVESNRKLCFTNGVRAFPTIKLFPAERQRNPYTGKYTKDGTDLEGQQTAKSVVAAVTANLTEMYISKLKSVAGFESFKSANSALPQAILFTSKAESTPLYKSLSMQFQGRLAFAEVHESVSDVVTLHEVEKFPTFIILSVDGATHKYEGELGAIPLRDFIREHAGPEPKEEDAAGKGKKEGAELPGLQIAPAAELGAQQLQDLDKKEDMQLVAFYSASGDECAASIVEFQKVVQELHGVVPAALFNAAAADAQLLGKYSLEANALAASPCALQLVLLPLGKDKQDLDEYQRYEGALETKAVQKWLYEQVPNLTMELNPTIFTRFLTAGPPTAAGTPMPKVLLITNKDEVPGVFKALAANLKGTNMAFGWVRSHVEENKPLLAQFNVPKVPHLVVLGMMPPDGKEQSDQLPLMIQPYGGPTKYNYMAFWLKAVGQQLGAGAGQDPAAHVPQVSSNELFNTHCVEKGGLCAIALLAPSSPSFEDQLAMLTKRALASRGSAISFMWVNARLQRGFLADFGLKQEDVPGVAVLSPKKLRYAVLTETFTEQNLKSLLDGLISGRVRTQALTAMPSLSAGGAGAADAEPAAAESPEPAEEVIEEEFDLSDIMAEDVSSHLPTKEEQLKELERRLQEEEEAKQKAEKAKKKKPKGKKGKKGKTEQKDEL